MANMWADSRHVNVSCRQESLVSTPQVPDHCMYEPNTRAASFQVSLSNIICYKSSFIADENKSSLAQPTRILPGVETSVPAALSMPILTPTAKRWMLLRQFYLPGNISGTRCGLKTPFPSMSIKGPTLEIAASLFLVLQLL
jgi:hypothetical protein